MKNDPRQLSWSSPGWDSHCPELRFLWFSAAHQDVHTWCRIGGEECFCFTLSSLLFITPIHSTSELLAAPIDRLEIVMFFSLHPFSAPSSFLIIYTIQFALFALLLSGSLKVKLHILPFHHPFYSLFCVSFIAFAKVCSPLRGIECLHFKTSFLKVIL
jgi:hypothetical protein